MKLSQFFLPLLKEDPKEASIVSHKLMLRAGMIRQLVGGIYSWLPLGLKVLNKVENIVRQEMNNAGAQELLLPCIQPIELWKKSGRYGTKDDLSTQMLRITDRAENALTFAPTAEEVICDVFAANVHSYKELPKNLYQIHWKFRDEIRPRFGVMRSREFLMKDAYSFHLTKESALNSYKDMLIAYLKAFNNMGLTAVPVKANTGAIGGDYSHEFHVLADTGESKIYYETDVIEYLQSGNITLDGLANYYANEEEKHDPLACKVSADKLQEKRGIEIGHIFYLGQKYSKLLDVKVQDKDGKFFHPEMGTYGIGVSRLVGAIIEANHDEKGVIWPDNVAPFFVGIINLKTGDSKCDAVAEDLYKTFQSKFDVLYDDTDDSAGMKFAKMELIGIPWVITVGPRGLQEGKVELKNRRSGDKTELSVESVKHKLLHNVKYN